MVSARYSGAGPPAVLRARSVNDVRQAVMWSARNGVRITSRSGGHSYAGYSTLTGGLVVDLSRLSQIAIVADRRTVQVGAGAPLIDLCTTLAGRGLTVPAGSCPHELHLPDPPGERGVLLLRELPVEPRRRHGRGLAALGAPRARRALLDLLALDRRGRPTTC
jgi:FAD binding domain